MSSHDRFCRFVPSVHEPGPEPHALSSLKSSKRVEDLISKAVLMRRPLIASETDDNRLGLSNVRSKVVRKPADQPAKIEQSKPCVSP